MLVAAHGADRTTWGYWSMEWPLTVERLVEATGDEYLERVEKLDMIFEKISNTDALSR